MKGGEILKAKIRIYESQAGLRRWLSEGLSSNRGWTIEAEAHPEDLPSALSEKPADLLVLDLDGLAGDPEKLIASLREFLPKLPVIATSSRNDASLAVRAMKSGAAGFLVKPLDIEELRRSLADALDSKADTGPASRRKIRSGSGKPFLKLPSPDMQRVYEQSSRVAMSSDTTVLITGESGTGKEIIARLIHDLSPRGRHSFLEINCASIPAELLESELFGHEAGAFTDARGMKQGLFETAGGGSIFLDEIGEMSLSLQVKLLRFLETHSFRRVGGTEDLEVDVRIISATNQDLVERVAGKRFREDLYYRLNVVPIRLSPLRERIEDILPLFEYFVSEFSERFNRRPASLDEEARRVLLDHAWPGNIRELRNAVERALLMATDEDLDAQALEDVLGVRDKGRPAGLIDRVKVALASPLGEEGLDLESLSRKLEIEIIRKALLETGGNKSRSAELLGLGRDKLRYRMKTLGIEAEDHR